MLAVERKRLFTAIAVVAFAMVLVVTWLHRENRRKPHSVVVRLPEGPAFDLRSVRFEPAGHVRSARLDEVRNLSLETDGAAFTVQVPELCPLRVASNATAVEARPLLRVEGNAAQVGYDAPVELAAVRGCPEAERGVVEWRQTEGLPLAGVAVSDGGARFRARTLPLASFFAEPLPAGIVAVSPRTQGRYVVEATLAVEGTVTVRRAVTITSIARATGLSSLAVSQRVMLSGTGYRVERAPPGSHARLEGMHGVTTFTPDVPGRFVLTDGAGKQMGVQALAHDRTPLDCGRSDCHAAIATAAITSPMSDALERPLHAVPPISVGCLLDCHVVGERGLHDGGFVDVMDGLGFRAPGPFAFEALPHVLRRLGGVRCTSCHGPSAIPEKHDRSRILRASVCATCHDAPPAYAHVEAWNRSAMARSDRAPETRQSKACARCHTTGGFLDAIGVRPRDDGSRDPDDAVVGIACAACHAPHGAHLSDTLVRAVPPPPSLALDATEAARAGPSLLCASCHAPGTDESVPSASSAALVFGKVRLPAALGGVESGPAPHANLPGGCMACHGAAGAARKTTNHAFDVAPTTCTTCHANGAPAEPGVLQNRAASIASTVLRSCAPRGEAVPEHAFPNSLSNCKLSPPRARALYLARLVSEDGAAATHNPAFASALLERAETLLGVAHR